MDHSLADGAVWLRRPVPTAAVTARRNAAVIRWDACSEASASATGCSWRVATATTTTSFPNGRRRVAEENALARFIEVSTDAERLALGVEVLAAARDEANAAGLNGWAVEVTEYLLAVRDGKPLNRPL